jgi:ubiquinol-cytochrome c reductase subunit 7
VERNCRLRRAADLDLKHDHLHGELLAKQTPGEHYLQVNWEFSDKRLMPGLNIYLTLFMSRMLQSSVPCVPQEALEEVRKERRERALLGTQPSYTRIYY